MRRFNSPPHQPRRGQALLLAVVIMIFAALLSASFIAIVSVNLNQTARQTDKNRAIVSAQAGMEFVKKQLAYSDEGERWLPTLNNPIPASTDNTYNFYYTALDRAQGWAGQYVKYPDPRTETGLSAGPQFLTKVERVKINDPDADQFGALRISVIGLSPEDPSAYSRSVAYFGGYKNSPVAQVMRVFSNWDFKTNRSVVAQSYPQAIDPAIPGAVNDGTTGTLGVSVAQGDFSKLGTPFLVNISAPRQGVAARSVVVTAVTPGIAAITPPNQPAGPYFILTLAQPLATAPLSTERVELAANLGASQGISYSNDATNTPFNPTGGTDIRFRISDSSVATPPITTNEVDGVRGNGGLVWSGDLLTTKLREFQSFSPTLAPGAIQVSGTMTLENVPAIGINPIVSTAVNIAKTDGSNVATLKSSDSIGIFASGTPNYQLVSDGWNSLRGISSNIGTRNIPEFQPPIIDSGAGVERYRNLTRFSKPNSAAIVGTMISPLLARHSLDGYGEGIYIDNVQDKEKKTGTGTTPVEMTQSELVKMWLSSSPVASASSYDRNGSPITPATPPVTAYPNASLEEQHLRGWVGSDEFRARGVEIELSNNSIIITRDSRDDNKGGTTNALGPVTTKTWKKASDGTSDEGVYRKVMAWPMNGVIFAEGNIRIKGNATNAPRSLTVVSMNNIYIEDSLSADDGIDGPNVGQPRKLLLMARKNVVMNPTRVLSRPDSQTLAPIQTAAAVNSSIDLPVSDSSDFRAGDIVETTSATTPVGQVDCIGRITTTPSAGSVNVKVFYSRTGNVEVNSSLRSHQDSKPAAITNVSFTKIGTAQDSIQRRFNLQPASPTTPTILSPTLRLDLRHQGVDAPTPNGTALTTPVFNVNTVAPATFIKSASPDTVYFSNKRVLNMGSFDPTAKTESDINKLVRGDYSGPPTSGTDTFFATSPASDAIANTAPFSLATLESEMDNAPPKTVNMPDIGWKYEVTVNPFYNQVPFYYLSSVGNRLDFAFPATPQTERRRNLFETAPPAANNYNIDGYNLPLATSIGVWLNGITPRISDDVSTVPVINQLGFSPKFQDVSNATPAPPEDVLTTDQSFYQPAASIANATVDSRILSGWTVGDNSLSFRQSEGLVNIVDATNPLPDYRLLGMKLEDVDLTNNTIKSAHTFNVNAFVYAQTGSWFVIPGADYETHVRGDGGKSYYDVNSNRTPDPGEWINGTNAGNTAGFDAGDAADLNRNGIVDPGEAVSGLRFTPRYNYQINFTGAIAENQTALVNDAGTGVTAVKGAVASWMDKWATTSLAAGAVTNDRIHYVFDPTVVLDNFQKDDPSTLAVEPTDTGFKLPQVPEVFNVS